MKILIAASEATPFVKTGGLADVIGALLREYRKSGLEASVVLPLYRTVRERFLPGDTGLRVHIPVGGALQEGKIRHHDDGVFFLECDEFFDREELYGSPWGDFPDNATRFVFYSRGVLDTCRALGLRPDVIHCNDWQSGLIPLYLKTLYRDDLFRDTATVMTIHNLGYQGVFEASQFDLTGLGWEWFTPEGIEFYGYVNFLKAGLIAADMITTVSETYAREIVTTDFGHGLDGVLRKRVSDLYGVLNGIDTDEWDPQKDRLIPARYSASGLSGKAACKEDLMRRCGLAGGEREAPLAAFVGRLSGQKGIDILTAAADRLVSQGVAVVVLGKGEERFHNALFALADRYGGRVSVTVEYDEDFAHAVYAGSDIFLMPSRYEPCGLGQMIAMRYGSVPVARRTGGLADTIEDYNPIQGTGTGFLFDEYSGPALVKCVKRALSVFGDRRRWHGIVARAMERDYSWSRSAARYRELYAAALAKKAVI